MTKTIIRFASGFLAFLGLAQAQLFVSSFPTSNMGAVIEYNSHGAPIATLPLPGVSPDPSGVAFGPDGNLYVADEDNNDVIEFNGQTGALIGTFVLPPPSSPLSSPTGITFGPDGNLYVANLNAVEGVYKFNGRTGAYIGQFVAAGSGGLLAPYGIAFGPDGNLYVADQNTDTVLEYNGTTGAFITALPGYSPCPNCHELPYGIVFGPDGSLYVTDSNNGVVLKYQNGALVGVFATLPGSSPSPTGIAFGPDGNLYVADTNNNDIIEFNGQTGAQIGSTPFVGPGSGGLNEPAFMVFAPAAPIDALQISYATNFAAADSFVNLTNAGRLGGTDPAGDICANVYVLAQDQQLISCCTCPLTPNHERTLSVRNDLINNLLTPGAPTAITIALLASTSCNASTVTNSDLAPGLRAWRTTPHALPSGSYSITEVPFSQVPLSQGELTKLTSFCGFIQSDGSKYGICNSCRDGAQGAVKQ
jgi:DNA-binding beta-propeller fold protein YncE